MKDYKFIPQEDPYYCLSACLQMILDKNSCKFDSQEQILEECGDQIREGNIEKYLQAKNYPLHCEDFPVNQSFCREFERLVRDALENKCDIIVGYAFDKLHSTKKEANHVSILSNYEFNNTILIDPDIKPNGLVYCNFDNLIKAMFTVSDGFHIIHPSKEILKELRKYF